MKKAEFIPAAREEFLAEVAFYNASKQCLGGQFASAAEKAVALVLAFPNIGSPGISGTLRVVIKGFPFWLVYKASSSSDIIIFAIAHQSRRPGYWINRVDQR